MIGRTNACIINGQGGEANPIVATTTDQMASLLTDDNVGKFVKFEGGNPNYHTISVDDAFTNLYFNEAADPDFEELWASADKDKIYGSYVEGGRGVILSLGPTVDDVQWTLMFMTQSSSTYKLNAILDDNYSIIYAKPIPEDALNPSDVDLTKWGWQMAQLPDDKVSALASYKYVVVNGNQSVWGKYIAKQNAFAAAYTYGQVYNILKIGEVISYKPVYALDKLSNQATSDAIITGYSAYDGSGKVITGAASKNMAPRLIDRGIDEVVVATFEDATAIGKGAFAGCRNVSKIIIPKTITNIYEDAFNGCSATIEWEDGTDSLYLNDHAFRGYTGSSITLPARLKSIGVGCFDKCTNLTRVDVPSMNMWYALSMAVSESDEVTNPLEYAHNLYVNGELFNGEITMSNMYYNDNMYPDNQWQSKFAGCTGVTTVNFDISNKDPNAGKDCFKGCTSLKTVNISTNVRAFGRAMFENCTSLSQIDLSNVGSINDRCFKGCSSLSVITLTKNDTGITIGRNAFEDCAQLLSINWNFPNSPSTVHNVRIGDYAFANCTKLATIVINIGSKSSVMLQSHAFDGCVLLTSLTTTGSLDIQEYGFNGCTSLTSVTSSGTYASYNEIYDYAFKGCAALEEIRYTAGATNVVKLTAFEDCAKLTGISGDSFFIRKVGTALPNNNITAHVTKTSGETLEGKACEGIKTLTFEDTISDISRYAFEDFTKLETVVLPADIHTFGERAFKGCTSISKVVFPSLDKYLNAVYSGSGPVYNNPIAYGAALYVGSDKVTSITIPASMTTIAYGQFAGLSIDSIVIPATVTSIGSYAFQDATCQISWEARTAALTLNSYAFSYYAGKTMLFPEDIAVDLPYSICSYGSFETLKIGANIGTIGTTPFEGCNRISKLVYGKTSTTPPKFNLNVNHLETIELLEGVKSFILDVTDAVNLRRIDVPSTIQGIAIYGNNCNKELVVNYATMEALLQCPLRKVTNTGFGAPTDLEHTILCNNAELAGDIELPLTTSKTIESYVFMNCSKITSIVIPEGVITVSPTAFKGCYSLYKITIPSTCTQGGIYDEYSTPASLVEVFDKSTAAADTKWWSSIKNVYTDESQSKITIENGCVVYADTSDNILVSYTGDDGNVIMPSTVTQVCANCLASRDDIIKVTCNEGLKTISNFAFTHCVNLESIHISSSVTKIPAMAFNSVCDNIPATLGSSADLTIHYSINKLQKITVAAGNSVYRSENNCIIKDNKIVVGSSGCKEIPNSVTAIGSFAFAGCNVQFDTIPESVVSFGDCAFLSTIGLKNVKIPSQVSFVPLKSDDSTVTDYRVIYGGRQFERSDDLKSIVFAENVTVANYAASSFSYQRHGCDWIIRGCKSLVRITLPKVINIDLLIHITGCSSYVDIDGGSYYRQGKYEFASISFDGERAAKSYTVYRDLIEQTVSNDVVTYSGDDLLISESNPSVVYIAAGVVLSNNTFFGNHYQYSSEQDRAGFRKYVRL